MQISRQGYKIHGNHHGGIHGGKEIVCLDPPDCKIEMRNWTNIQIHAQVVILEDGTRIQGPIIHAFVEGPGCT